MGKFSSRLGSFIATQTAATERVLITPTSVRYASMSLIAGATLAFTALPASAGPVDTLLEAMRFEEVVDILAAEGRDMSTEMAEADFGVPKPSWDLMLGELYDTPSMQTAFNTSLTEALEGADIDAMIAFFESDVGQKLANSELLARQAISDDDVKDAAADAWSEMDADSPRALQIDEYVDTNDLLEMNVVSALNADIAYLRGLTTGSLTGLTLSEDEILRDVWSSEGDTRARVSEWLYAFSVLAYEPLSDEEFAAYIAFGATPEGQALNTALFYAFDQVYADLSFALGAGTAQLMQSAGGTDL